MWGQAWGSFCDGVEDGEAFPLVHTSPEWTPRIGSGSLAVQRRDQSPQRGSAGKGGGSGDDVGDGGGGGGASVGGGGGKAKAKSARRKKSKKNKATFATKRGNETAISKSGGKSETQNDPTPPAAQTMESAVEAPIQDPEPGELSLIHI